MGMTGEVVAELAYGFCLLVGHTLAGFPIVAAVVGEGELGLSLPDCKVTDTHTVLQQTEGKIAVGLPFLQRMAEKHFAVNGIGGAPIGYRNHHLVPAVGAEQMRPVRILLEQRLHPVVSLPVVFAVVYAEAGRAVVIAAITDVEKVQRIVILEDTRTPLSTRIDIVGMLRICGSPETVHVTQAVVPSAIHHHLYAVAYFIVARQTLVIPKRQAVGGDDFRHTVCGCHPEFPGGVFGHPFSGIQFRCYGQQRHQKHPQS